ncbi:MULTISPECIES: LysR family transcriptional regulator [Pseudomonas]|uniref:LysR family transcriptional regulator n=1 Tax=Pseudomonas promysalinigenes TaxID=485898 RepID=A0ABY6AI28_9PSED|nr:MULTISPECIES: LysR family transcriptional regulator [Pseudomonas]AUA33505.1 LysR family transcriptional regulator [Pseudomonas sp. SGAir0191]UXH38805.1 LysR family transcriptional regulator [Pseudomonas promysalinigenes]
MKHLKLVLLHTFVMIVECRSLSLAATRLHKSHATISIQLKKLGNQVGTRLLNRGHQVVGLTPAGELLRYSRRILALSREALVRLSNQEPTGNVHFGIADDYAKAFLAPIIGRFTTQYPRLRLIIRNDIS